MTPSDEMSDLKVFISDRDAPELQSGTDYDNADLGAMQRAFDEACQEMGLGPDRPDARAVIARAIFAAYQVGLRGERKLNEAAWEARSIDRLQNTFEIDKTTANIAKQQHFSYTDASTLAD